jgi:hypothetical protein
MFCVDCDLNKFNGPFDPSVKFWSQPFRNTSPDMTDWSDRPSVNHDRVAVMLIVSITDKRQIVVR